MENKRIVIFGSTGTVGAYTCLYLKELGFEIIACGHRKTDNNFFSEYCIKYFSIDITNKADFNCLPQQGVFAVVNLSGALPARMKGYNPQQYIDVNITGSLNIYEYCAKSGAQIVLSTISISDVSYLCGNTTPISSDALSKFPLNNDHSVYCISKKAAADILTHYAHKYNFKYYLLRFPNIYLYHPNPFYYVDGENKWQGYRLMIHKAIRNEHLSIWGNPKKVRDIVYVKDCTQIIGLCLQGIAPSGTYNVGTGIGTSIEEQVKGIIAVFGHGDIPSIELQKPDTPEYIFDISKTTNLLGYQPKYNYMDYLYDFKQEMKLQRFNKLWGYDVNNDHLLL